MVAYGIESDGIYFTSSSIDEMYGGKKSLIFLCVYYYILKLNTI